MPDTPALARFLTDEERDWALRRMRMDASHSTTLDVDQEEFGWHWVKMALTSPQVYFCAAIWFFLLVPLYVGYVPYIAAMTEHQGEADRDRRASLSSCHPSYLA
jgi:hypothetical protein